MIEFLGKLNKMLNLKPKFGFTLLEMIVVVGITTLLTGILIIYSNQSRSQILLNSEKAKVAQTILRSKSLALAGFTDPPSFPPPCSYGFFIDYSKSAYSLFEYTPSNCADILNTSFIDKASPDFRLFSTDSLPKNLAFDLGVDRLGYVIFIPPDPDVLVFDETGTLYFNPMAIYLKTQDGSLKTKININHQTGQLSF